MYEKISKKIFRKYIIQCFIFGIIWTTLFFILMMIFDNLIVKGIILLLFFNLIKRIIKELIRKNFLPIFHNELNPEKFKYVIFSNKNFAPHAQDQLLATLFSGDYQTAINICTKALKTFPDNTEVKYAYMPYLAKAYFELQDLEKLKIICDKYYESIENPKKDKVIENLNSLIQYYHSFCVGNFEYGISYCQKRETEISKRTSTRKINIANNKFYYAITYYKLGNLEKAKQYFEELIEFAPKINMANIAKRYLAAIESGDEKLLENPEILPDDDFEIYRIGRIHQNRRYRIVLYILLCILAISLIIPDILTL